MLHEETFGKSIYARSRPRYRQSLFYLNQTKLNTPVPFLTFTCLTIIMTIGFLEEVFICVVLGLSASLYVKDHNGMNVWHDDSNEESMPATSYTMAPL